MATARKTRKGFWARCPMCGEPDSLVSRVEDVHVLICRSCHKEFSTDDVRAVMAGWQQLLRWLDTAPPVED